jgi:hypothetical protein
VTKRRAPLTYEDALNRVIGAIGMDAAAAATGRTPDYLRALTDPDKRYTLTIEDAEKLDLAYTADGNPGAPIFDTYATRLRIAHREAFADHFALVERIAHFIKEGGEASYAMIRASLPGSGPVEHRDAVRETQEVVEAANALIAFFMPKPEVKR